MRGATAQDCSKSEIAEISIHAPHAGSDWWKIGIPQGPGISIHAPHAGSDVPWDS